MPERPAEGEVQYSRAETGAALGFFFVNLELVACLLDACPYFGTLLSWIASDLN